MYEEVKAVLGLLASKPSATFTYIFKHVSIPIAPAIQEKIKQALIEDDYIRNVDGEGNEFGFEPTYQLTISGKSFYDQIKDLTVLDQILEYLNRFEDQWFLMEKVCKEIGVAFSKTYALQLEGKEMVDFTDQSGLRYYKISRKGENWITVLGGYRQQLILIFERRYRQNGLAEQQGESKPQTDTTINQFIQTENYFDYKQNDIMKSTSGTEPLRNRILKCLYDSHKSGTERIEAREVATLLNENTRTVHDTLTTLAGEGLLSTPAKAVFEMIDGQNTHMYYFSITHTGINIIESGQTKPQTSVKIKAKNYFHNQNSTIEKQAGTINEAPPAPKGEKKGTHWLQIVYWIVGIIVAGFGIYASIKAFV